MKSTFDHSLHAVHRVVLRARLDAYGGVDHKRIATLLDHTEYLIVQLMQHPPDLEEFRRYLQGITITYPELLGVAEELVESEPVAART